MAKRFQRRSRASRALAWLLLAACLGVVPAQAKERITAFDSAVVIEPSGLLQVTETIDVIAEGNEIRRGIYRDFPTIYPHSKWPNLGLRDTTTFDLQEVTRDGQPEPWHQQSLANGVRTFIGNEAVRIKPGAHRYQIRYQTDRQMRFGEDEDSLYWNVTGQGWTFPIERATVSVQLAEGGVPLAYQGWTGAQGAQGQDFELSVDGNNHLRGQTTRPFSANEGFTIRVTYPKGVLTPTSDSPFLASNWKWLLGLFSLLAMPLYYFIAWSRHGRDPEKGVIVADYHPVRDLSPAVHRYINRNKYDNQTFAAAILNMAIKGYLTIEQQGKKKFELIRTDKSPGSDLSEGEALLHKLLFKTQSVIKLGSKYQPQVASAKKQLRRYLKNEYQDAVYKDNRRYTWIGLAFGVAALLLFSWHFGNMATKALQPIVVLVVGFVLVGVLANNARNLPFLLAAVSMMSLSIFNTRPDNFSLVPIILIAVVVALLYLLFNYLLKAPTPFGRKVLDEIAGFRLYLSTAEQHRLNILHPPERTPELFERLLPYALALGVENEWSEQFADVLGSGVPENRRYTPDWYHGGEFGRFGSSGFASAVGAGLASSVAAAATAPSSSGSGGGFGGGGAGGGGGGGGGGGW